jgi:hypothetical protein
MTSAPQDFVTVLPNSHLHPEEADGLWPDPLPAAEKVIENIANLAMKIHEAQLLATATCLRQSLLQT